MIQSLVSFKRVLTKHLEIDDMQAVDLLLATMSCHKMQNTEMLWMRLIGASGTAKTEMLRAMGENKDYCDSIESITAGSIRRGYIIKGKKDEMQQAMLSRLNGKLVITKEFAIMLTKDMEAQKEIFGLLRGVHDGELTADYGSEQGHLTQTTRFDWIIGTTQYVERQRQLEQLLGSRFIDLRWGKPINHEAALNKAVDNSNMGLLPEIRKELADSIAGVVDEVRPVALPRLPYLAGLAQMIGTFRTPVERDKYSHEIIDVPQVELATRAIQALGRISVGLMMLGIDVDDLKPYMVRLVLDAMTDIRSKLIRCWLKGITKQKEVAGLLGRSEGAISYLVEDMNALEWQDSMLEQLRI